MEKNELEFNEDWIKINNNDVPEGEYVVTDFSQNANGVRILLEDGIHTNEIFFDGIPILVSNSIEGLRMRTWSEVQLKYNDKFIFRKSFLFEVKKSELIKWCIHESCGFFEENQLRHYCIITCEEMLDIISTFEPIIRNIN